MGCVLAELVLRRPWLAAETDIQQLGLIFSVFGTPQEDVWKGITDLPSYLPFTPCKGKPLEEIFPQVRTVVIASSFLVTVFIPGELILLRTPQKVIGKPRAV
jgi:cyclin-dependent kinase 7